jgi:outer membrane immunogenic protein
LGVQRLLPLRHMRVENALASCERRTRRAKQHANNAPGFRWKQGLGMKTFFLLAALTGAAAMTATASAAPLTTTAPPYSWTGFYVGGDIGGAYQHGRGTSNFFQNTAVTALASNIQQQSPKNSSVIGGIHAGFNWQFAPSWVIGIEGDWQWARLRDSFCRQTDIDGVACSDTNVGFATIESKTPWIATVRGRFGWTFDRWMVYGTGGVAFADVRTSLGVSCLVNGCGLDSTQNATTAESSRHKAGWAAGIGVERTLGQNWIVRAEYRHVGLGNVSTTLRPDPCSGHACGLSWSRDLRYEVLRLGISYKFGGL